jgi:hypothetical protein
MTPAPENRSCTGEAVAALAFRSLLPGPDQRPVGQQGVELVGVGGPSGPAGGRAVWRPGVAAQQRHLREAVPDRRQRSWADSSAASLPTLTPTARRRSTRPAAAMTSTAGVFGPSSTTSQPRDPSTLVTSVIGSPRRSPADAPIIVVAAGSPDAPTYRTPRHRGLRAPSLTHVTWSVLMLLALPA